MIEAKGTRKEWEKLASEIREDYNSKEGNVSDVILRCAQKQGWITKPEWEQAYDECQTSIDDFTDSLPATFEPIKKMIWLMHARIIELEAKEGM